MSTLCTQVGKVLHYHNYPPQSSVAVSVLCVSLLSISSYSQVCGSTSQQQWTVRWGGRVFSAWYTFDSHLAIATPWVPSAQALSMHRVIEKVLSTLTLNISLICCCSCLEVLKQARPGAVCAGLPPGHVQERESCSCCFPVVCRLIQAWKTKPRVGNLFYSWVELRWHMFWFSLACFPCVSSPIRNVPAVLSASWWCGYIVADGRWQLSVLPIFGRGTG